MFTLWLNGSKVTAYEQINKEYSYDHDYDYYEEPDYAQDTWDAMTDGMYGDMPEGFDGDYSFLGY